MNANEKAALRAQYKAGHPDSFGAAHVEEAVLAHELGVALAEQDVAREWLKRHMRRMDEMALEVGKLRQKKQKLIAHAQAGLAATAVVGLSISMDELSETVRKAHVKKLTTPDTESAATRPAEVSAPAKQPRKKADPPTASTKPEEAAIPQPEYAGPFKTWPKSAAPSVELDRKEIDTLHSAYSADTIAEKGSKTRRPVKIGGTTYISTGGADGGSSGRSYEDGYELIPLADYPLPTHRYSAGSWEGYEGMIVSAQGVEAVLTRPVHFWHQDPPKIAPTLPIPTAPEHVMDTLAGKQASMEIDPVIDDEVDQVALALAEEAIYADQEGE